MPTIRQDDLIDSVADALQFISYYHPKDFIDAVHQAYLREESKATKFSACAATHSRAATATFTGATRKDNNENTGQQ